MNYTLSTFNNQSTKAQTISKFKQCFPAKNLKKKKNKSNFSVKIGIKVKISKANTKKL